MLKKVIPLHKPIFINNFGQVVTDVRIPNKCILLGTDISLFIIKMCLCLVVVFLQIFVTSQYIGPYANSTWAVLGHT